MHQGDLLRTMFMNVLLPSLTIGEYNVGVGIADCTGPSADIVFMGYAKTNQKGCGIHLRQFSRAFIIDDGNKRVAFVSIDSAMMAYGVKKEVLYELTKLYNNTYNINNLVLSSTHSHSTPGGFTMELMLDIPTFGFVKDTFNALTNGIVKSIRNAHENMHSSKIFLSTGQLLNANINRSPTSYLLNPENERSKYPYNVDKEMVQLKFIRSSDNYPLGVINWFAVHPTSMNNTNCLLSSDNVGYASILFENYMNNKQTNLLGKGPFVAAFASTNLGDVSPNIKGARCINNGEVCDDFSSTCGGQAQFCIASGPGRDMFESTQIIAKLLYNKAKELWNNNKIQISGPIKYIHQYVRMDQQNFSITLPNGTIQNIRGCLPAMGYSFAAGTTDGVGEFNFKQGTKSSNPFWNTIRDFLFIPTSDDIACHYPKPILINSGKISVPYEWQPEIVSIQLLLIGNVVLIAVPGEFTTMSGRRMREAIKETFENNKGSANIKPIIAGLSNVYTNYITTFEEYQMQRYEGASTIYGPHTLNIYIELYKNLATAMIHDQPIDSGPYPPNVSSKLISLTPSILFDITGSFKHKFGDCILQPPEIVERSTTVVTKFIAGHPRNNNMLEKTFLLVERLLDGDRWESIATDANWETQFIWNRNPKVYGASIATIKWTIPEDTPSNVYRIRHFGYYKHIFGGIFSYEGSTNKFVVQ